MYWVMLWVVASWEFGSRIIFQFIFCLSWYFGVFIEGLFLMMPEQEAAMRDAGFQRKYAEAILEGLEAYFRELGRP